MSDLDSLPIAEALRIQNLYAAAHFRSYLFGETEYQSYLTTSYAEANEPDVVFFAGEAPIETPLLGFGGQALLALGMLLAAASTLRGSPRR